MLFVPIIFDYFDHGKDDKFSIEDLPVVMDKAIIGEIFFLIILILTFVSFLVKPDSKEMIIQPGKTFRFRLMRPWNDRAVCFISLAMQKIGLGLWEPDMSKR
ncbi:MAG: hypothetical protein IPL26_10800 [Leptospiraceae bacterium]|nr:hypothetical protein [Leptospiraceae bacterium]